MGKLRARYKNIIALLKTSNQVLFLANTGDSPFKKCAKPNITSPPLSLLPTLSLLGASSGGEPSAWAHSSSIPTAKGKVVSSWHPLSHQRCAPWTGSSQQASVPPLAGGRLGAASGREEGDGGEEMAWLKLLSDVLVGLGMDWVKGSLHLPFPVSFPEFLWTG